ncbi:hypothetical protein [Kitasatospora sp. NPDC091207]|uniref:hypothetical protein n=1 Tax=Kitasatospora sp. NPDC091207 TaxID=3364083 RepID=UPI00382ED782
MVPVDGGEPVGSGLEVDVRKAAAEAGRAPEAITPALFGSVRVDDSVADGRRALDAYAHANYGLPLEELERIQAVVTGTPEDVVAGLSRYRDAGARHVVVQPGALDLPSQRDQLRRLAALLPDLT